MARQQPSKAEEYKKTAESAVLGGFIFGFAVSMVTAILIIFTFQDVALAVISCLISMLVCLAIGYYVGQIYMAKYDATYPEELKKTAERKRIG